MNSGVRDCWRRHLPLMAGALLALPAAPAAIAGYLPQYWPSGTQRNSALDQACIKVKDIRPPRGDVPTRAVLDSLSGCDSAALYYDAKANPHATRADWDKVRACAFAEQSPDILMMLYANGDGVKVNSALAIHYACGIDAPELEVENMIGDLSNVEPGASTGHKAIDRCDYASVTPTIGACTGWRAAQRDIARDRLLDGLSQSWNTAQRNAFQKLRTAVNVFADRRASVETDETGSYRGSDAIEEGARVQDQFLADIRRCEKHAFPHGSPAKFAALDKQLNRIYRAVLRARAHAEVGTITPDGIRQTERAWLACRDAWVAFGKLRYPDVTAHAWKAWLTQRRIQQLKELQGASGW